MSFNPTLIRPQEILETIDNGIIILDDSLHVLFWNRWLEFHTKIPAHDIVGRNLSELFPYIQTQKLKRKIKSALLLNTPTFYSVDPHHYLIDIKLTAITDNTFESMQQNVTIVPYDQKQKLVCLYIYDQTPLSEINQKLSSTLEELQRYKDSLESKVREEVRKNLEKDKMLMVQSRLAAMGEMISAIAHQWRQPLNALALNIQFLEEDYEEGSIDQKFIRSFTRTNMQLITYMSQTIDDFRNFFRIDKAKERFKVKEKSMQITAILDQQLSAHDIRILFEGEEFEIIGHASEFQQVIINIVNNAKDALIARAVEDGYIRLSFRKETEGGIIQICDNAGGIPEEIIDRIFDPYFTTKGPEQGTGLGLYMSRMIIHESLGGSLLCKNSDEGACFLITVRSAYAA